jgi:nitrile hydratase subunit alpha
VFLLPLVDSRSPAGLVQVRALSLAVSDRPRGVLREFGLELPEDVEVRVWDSTAELRYLVLTERPVGSEKMSEEELAAQVTRDAMIGVAKVNLSRTGGAE